MRNVLGLPAHLWTLAVWSAAICVSALTSGVLLSLIRGDVVHISSILGVAFELAIVVAILVLRSRTPVWVIHVALLATLVGASVVGANEDSVDAILFAVVNAVLVVLYAGFWWHGRVASTYAAIAAASLLVLVIPNDSLSIRPETWVLIAALLGFESYCMSLGVRRFEFTSTHDALTGLLNTTALHAYLEIHPTSGRALSPRTLMSIDLDDFKVVNDSHGHQAGDTLLRACSSAWAHALRPDDLLFRVGGDEFLLILPQTEPIAAAFLERRLHDAHSVQWSSGRTAWIDAESFDTALARADALMYRDKQERRRSRRATAHGTDAWDVESRTAEVAPRRDRVGRADEPSVSTTRQTTLDALTGLISDGMLSDRIEECLAHRGRRGGRVAVAFLGLDRFERVNQSLGMRSGDELLVEVSQRLSHRLRAGDTLARFSGDEFVVVMASNVGDDSVQLSQRLLDSFTEPFTIDGRDVAISASVGVASTLSHPPADELLEDAASAMSAAKRHGGNCVQQFDHGMREQARRGMTVESELRAALKKSELVLHYQPVIDLERHVAVGVEALVRWPHADGRMISPAEFIPIAEASGLIVPLGRWVLDRACRDAVTFTGPAEDLHLSVNVSARELATPNLVGDVRDALNGSGLDPTRLFLEITESALMENEELAEETLGALTRLGVHISVDDFGTGYSSLLYLRRYPITILKVDQAFVAGIGTNADDEAICRSVISLAHSLNLTAVAEGVETQDQAAALRSYGCRYAQGFLWSPAVRLADLNLTLTGIAHPESTSPSLALTATLNPVTALARQPIPGPSL